MAERKKGRSGVKTVPDTHAARSKRQAGFDPAVFASAPLIDRLLAFDARMPAPIAPVARSTTAAVFDEARAIAAELESVLRSLDGKRRIGRVEFDFDLPTYADFLERERGVQAGLRKLPDAAFAFLLAGDGTALRIADDRSTRGQFKDEPGEPEPTGVRKWIAKLFAALGVGELYGAVLEVLEDDRTLKLLLDAIRRKDWDSAKTFLKMLLRFLGSSEFLRKLGQKIGQTAAAKLVGSILGKCLPFVGWALLIGSFIWAVVEQFI
jgi:hypothetical protein